MRLETYEKIMKVIEQKKEIPLKDLRAMNFNRKGLDTTLYLLEKRGFIKIIKKSEIKKVKYKYAVARWKG